MSVSSYFFRGSNGGGHAKLVNFYVGSDFSMWHHRLKFTSLCPDRVTADFFPHPVRSANIPETINYHGVSHFTSRPSQFIYVLQNCDQRDTLWCHLLGEKKKKQPSGRASVRRLKAGMTDYLLQTIPVRRLEPGDTGGCVHLPGVAPRGQWLFRARNQLFAHWSMPHRHRLKTAPVLRLIWGSWMCKHIVIDREGRSLHSSCVRALVRAYTPARGHFFKMGAGRDRKAHAQ